MKRKIANVAFLCDINVIFNLATNLSTHTDIANRWFDTLENGEGVICRFVQMGFFRLVNNPIVMKQDVLSGCACWEKWAHMMEDERFRFVPVEPSGLTLHFKRHTTRLANSPSVWSDAYLAAFAKSSELTLVTFDAGFRQYTDLDVLILGT